MGDFFHGWRRKIGCVTLLMALVFMGLWMRISLNKDAFQFECGTSFLTIASNQNGLCWVTSELPGRLYQPSKLRGQSEYWSLPGRRMPFFTDPFGHLTRAGWTSEWRRNWCGFHLGRYCNEHPIAGIRLTMRIIPHWAVVWPLILVSAYLLITTRRPRTVKRLDELPA